MATAQERLEIEVLYDDTKLKAGTEEAERSIESLADSVERASLDMQDSLDRIDDGVSSTLGTGGTFSRTVDDVEAEGGRMSGIGSEIGAEFSENIGEGFRNGDIAGVFLETFTSLGPALGVAGIGLGIGAAMVNGMIQGAKEREAEFVAKVNEILDTIEFDAKTSSADIKQAILDAFSVEEVLKDYGGEQGLKGAVLELNKLVDATGTETQDWLDLLQTGVNPRTKEIRETAREIVAEAREQARATGSVNSELADTAATAQRWLEFSRTNADVQKDVRTTAQDVARWVKEDAEQQNRAADAAERQRDALREAEEAARRLGGNLGNAVRQAGLLDLALSGKDYG